MKDMDCLENILKKWLTDLGAGLAELHSLDIVHADIKPENLALDKNERLLINDLGTATCASLELQLSPRDNMGFRYTRAPEKFRKGSEPTKSSDTWAASALGFRLFTGRYPLEDMLYGAEPEEKIARMSIKEGNEMIARGIARAGKKGYTFMGKIPRDYRAFLTRGLNFDPCARFADGSELRDELKKITGKKG